MCEGREKPLRIGYAKTLVNCRRADVAGSEAAKAALRDRTDIPYFKCVLRQVNMCLTLESCCRMCYSRDTKGKAREIRLTLNGFCVLLYKQASGQHVFIDLDFQGPIDKPARIA